MNCGTKILNTWQVWAPSTFNVTLAVSQHWQYYTGEVGGVIGYIGDSIYECYMDSNDFIHVCYLNIVYIQCIHVYVCVYVAPPSPPPAPSPMIPS